MIWDKENLFFDEQALSATSLTSDVVFVGTGEAACPVILEALVANGSTGGTLSLELQTCADSGFSSYTTLGTFTDVPLSVTVPRGNLGYLRLVATSTYTAGTLTAGLVLEDNINW